jgi:hypothetical protein
LHSRQGADESLRVAYEEAAFVYMELAEQVERQLGEKEVA